MSIIGFTPALLRKQGKAMGINHTANRLLKGNSVCVKIAGKKA